MTLTPSGFFRVVEGGTKALLLIGVGLAFLAGGIWLTAYAVEHPPLQKVELYSGLIAAVFGALLLPGILDPAIKVSRSVIVIVQQLPVVGAMFGGKRATDPQPPEPKP